MKQYLSELRFDEIKKVLDNNSDLWDKALDRAVDDAYVWVDEYLSGAGRIKDIDYLIGYDRGAHFTVKDMTSEVLDWIHSVQGAFELFDESTVEKAEKCAKMYDYVQYGYDNDGIFEGKSEDEVYDEYEELRKEVGYEIFDKLQNEIMYWYTTPDSQLVDDLADIFMDYMDEIVDGDPDDIIVDTDTGEFIEDDPFDEDEDEDEYPDQLKLPGFED